MHELRRRGRRISRKRVERLMRERGIVGITRRRRRRSLTEPDFSAVPALDLIGRGSPPRPPGSGWSATSPTWPTGEGSLYPATTIDLFSWDVIGHAVADHMRPELVCDAVRLAHRRSLVEPDAHGTDA